MGGSKRAPWKESGLNSLTQYSNFFKNIYSFTTTCPSCGGKEFSIVEFTYSTPYGDILVINGYCSLCGYRFFDIFNLETHEPVKLILRIEEPDDLRSLIMRSNTASIEIPEFGIEIQPGPAALPFITTVDGILYRVLDVLVLFSKNESMKMEELINRAIDGEACFTLILEDPYGNSAIIPYKKDRLRVVRLGKDKP